MYVFYISGKHSASGAAVPVSCLESWPGEAQRNLCMDVPSLFDSLVEYIISAFLGVFL